MKRALALPQRRSLSSSIRGKLLAGILVAVVAAFFTFDMKLFREFLWGNVERSLLARGIHLSAEEPSFGWLSVRAQQMTLRVVGTPVPIQIRDVEIGFTPKLFPPGVSYDFKANAYRGTVVLTGSITSKGVIVSSGTARALDLAQHPLVQGFGFESALLNVDTLQVTPESAYAAVTLQNIVKPRPTTLARRLVGAPFDVPLPAFSISSASMTVSSQLRAVLLEKLQLSSDLGSLRSDSLLVGRGGSGVLFLTPTPEGLSKLPLNLICAGSLLKAGSPVEVTFAREGLPTCGASTS